MSAPAFTNLDLPNWSSQLFDFVNGSITVRLTTAAAIGDTFYILGYTRSFSSVNELFIVKTNNANNDFLKKIIRDIFPINYTTFTFQ